MASKEQAQKLQEIKNIEEFKCEISLHPRFNDSKGLICIYKFNLENLDEFRQYLKEPYNIIDVQLANFKTKILRPKSLL